MYLIAQIEQEIGRTVDAAIRFNSRVKRMLGAVVHDVEVVRVDRSVLQDVRPR